MQKILIMGADKTVGNFLVERLGQMGVKCRAACHNPQRLHSGDYSTVVERVPFDFSDKLSIERAFNQVSALFLLTPENENLFSNVKSSMEVARDFSIKQVVYVSLLGGENPSCGGPLIKLHRQAEDLIRNSSIPYTILRPNCLMQSFLSLIEPSTGMIYLPMGEAKVSLIDARDVAIVAADIFLPGAHHYYKTYNLTGKEALSMHQVASRLSEVSGVKVGYVDVPESTAAENFRKIYPRERVGMILEYLKLLSSGQASLISSAEEVVARAEPIQFIDFARDYAEEIRGRLAA
ncbi:MAG: NmrA family NAD(P)-binding protein [Fibrobacter sp.]|jgi:NAD(P)H dehydrogenase (quinone)|nr:NmrA family NAD(P)-binding protein [Fibrobacter sp.]